MLGLAGFLHRDLEDLWFYWFGEGRQSPYHEMADVSINHLASDIRIYGYSKSEPAQRFCLKEALEFKVSPSQAQSFCECYVPKLREKFGHIERAGYIGGPKYNPRNRYEDYAWAERRYCTRRMAEINRR